MEQIVKYNRQNYPDHIHSHIGKFSFPSGNKDLMNFVGKGVGERKQKREKVSFFLFQLMEPENPEK